MSHASDHRKIRLFWTVAALVVALAAGGIAVAKYRGRNVPPDARFDLAQCLTEKNAKFYGAFWCPHCAQQKKLFGKAISKVLYVECAVPGNQQTQTQACKEANISGYPTWTFADGSRLSGEQSLRTLADKTGCEWKE